MVGADDLDAPFVVELVQRQPDLVLERDGVGLAVGTMTLRTLRSRPSSGDERIYQTLRAQSGKKTDLRPKSPRDILRTR
jgi:hypothetical protein